MRTVARVILVGCASFSVVAGFQGASAFAATTISVGSYGAKCNGVTDDRFAIQSALNAAAAAGGGTVALPGSTCLLNSFAPSSHPWIFYNLHIPSNVTLQGTTGSKLLQGPNGRQLMGNIPGASYVENAVVTAGNDFATVHFQNVSTFYSLNAMTVGSPSVTLSTAAQAANFTIGDYVAIYEYTSGDVLPAQMSQVTGVNVSAGQLTLADPVIRAFATPSLAKVTSLAAHNVAINDVVVQGATPLAVTETFHFSASHNQFLSDTSIGGGNLAQLELNTMEHFTFTGNTIAAINGPYIHQELCQRDSQNGVWTGNTFQETNVGFGEYAANITMTNNHIYLHPDGTGIGVSLGGMNVVFSGNDVHTIGNQSGGYGWGFIVTDVYAPLSYYGYTGNIQITKNTMQCVANGNNCLLLTGHGTVASGNTITATGWTTGVYVADAYADVTNNTIKMGQGMGMVLYTPPYCYATVTGNTLTGTGSIGIYMGSLPAPGGYKMYSNTITGFATPMVIDPH